MRTHIKVIVLLITLALCIMVCGSEQLWAQRRGGTRGGKPQTAGPGQGRSRVPTPEFDNTPFDITRTQLPAGYLGNNAQLLYNSVKDRVAKDKPEGDIPLVGTLRLAGTFAFHVKPTENDYSVREHVLKIYCELSTILEKATEEKTERGFRVDYVPQTDNRYTYTDAKGVKIEVEEVKFRDYTIAFANLDQFRVERAVLPGMKEAVEKGARKGSSASNSDDGLKREGIVGSFSVAAAEAEQLTESARLLVLCTLVEPYVTSETVHLTGTPEKPREYLAQHQYLHVRLLELWYYDFLTGNVLLKIKPGEAQH